jgi:hypothetical protein
VRRRPSRVLVVLSAVVAVGVSGCSANSVKQESTTSALPTSATTRPTTTKPTTTKPTTTKAASETPASPAATIAIPKVEPHAQGAVNSYIAFLRAEVFVGQDPGQIRRSGMTMYLGAKALKAVNAQLDAMAAAGTAFRGNPDDPRVTVDTVASSKLVLLYSCPLPAKTNPYHVITVKTGKQVVPPKQSPPPPYQLLLFMFLNKKNHWVLIKFSQDTSRTCTG